MQDRRALPAELALVSLIALAGCSEEKTPDSSGDQPAVTQQQQQSPSSDAESDRADEEIERLQETLISGSPRERVGAAHRTANMSDVPAAERTEILVFALDRELSRPSAEGAPAKTYLSTTDWIRAEFTRALGVLARDATRPLEDVASQESGEVRDRLIVAQGYAGHLTAVTELRRILLEAEHGDVRTDAAYVLGELGDTTAIPELIQALADPHMVSYEDFGQTVSFYSVRVHAATALEKLGVEVRTREDGSYEVPSR